MKTVEIGYELDNVRLCDKLNYYDVVIKFKTHSLILIKSISIKFCENIISEVLNLNFPLTPEECLIIREEYYKKYNKEGNVVFFEHFKNRIKLRKFQYIGSC